MKSTILFIFILLTQFCLGQNTDLIKKESMMLFNEGKIKEALSTLEQIKDKETLENTDINTWKKHFKNILDYKFSEKFVVNDSIKIVTVRTSLFTHCGIYNSNTKKYINAPIYDDIPNINPISKYFVIALNHQKGLIDLSGKTIIPSGNYDIIVNVYNKFITVVSNDGNAIKDFYDWDGKLVGHNLSFFQEVKPNYIITQNDFNKFQLLNTDTGQFVLENCDAIEDINRYRNPNPQEVFIKKENQSAIYNFVTNSFSAHNDFHKIIPQNENTNVFTDYQYENTKNNVVKEVSEKNRYIVVKKNTKFGVFDITQKKYYIEPIYDSITYCGNCLQNNVWRNLKYEYPIKEDYDDVSEAVVYIKNNLFGLKSVANKTITEAEYDEVEQKSTGLFLIKKQKLWGWIFIEKNKISTIKPQFDYVYLSYERKYDSIYKTYSETYLICCFKNKTKKFTLEGKEIPNAISNNEKGYSKKETVTTISSNRRLTTQKRPAKPDEGIFDDEDLFGLDDYMGNEIVKPIYKKIEPGPNSKDYFVIYNSGSGYDKVGVIDENGKIIIPINYGSIDSFDNNFYLVQEGYFFGLINKDGKEVVPIDNKEIKVFLDGLYIVKGQDDLCKVIDAQNKTIYVFPKFCNKIYSFEKIVTNKAEVFYSMYLGFREEYEEWSEHFLIRDNWSTRILEKYNIQKIYKNKLIQLESNKLIGFYDLNTQKLIEPKFKKIWYDYAHKLIYCKIDKYFDTIIDENLNITDSKDQISYIYKNVIFYEKDGKYGFFDKNNQKTKNTFQSIEIEHPIYSSNQKLYKYYDNKDNKKGGLIDENGKIIIKANRYDEIYDLPSSSGLVFSNRKFKKEELEQILICKNNSDKTTDKIDFVTLYGNKIASTTISKNNYSVDFISKNGIALLKASDETIFFNLIENKIISKVNSASVIIDVDGGFTILKNEASIVDPKKVLAQKYSTNGNLISTRIIERNQNTRNIEDWNFYLVQKKENKFGIIGVDEKNIIPFEYDTIIPSISPIYIAKKNNKFGMIDRDNNILLNFEYDTIDTEYLSEYVNKREGRYDKIDYEVKDIVKYAAKTSFNFIVSKDHKTGILGSNLKFILPLEYDSFRKERSLFGNIIARKGVRSMVYTSQGNFLFQVECDSLVECQNYYKIYKDNKQGILDQKGVGVFPMRYAKVEKTNFENLFILEKDSKKYVTNAKGEIISRSYDEINESKFYNHFEVKINNKVGLMNKKGTIVITELYDSMVQISGTYYMILSLNGKEGIVDMNSEKNEILPIKIPISYAKIKGIVNKKYIIVSNNSKEGVIDLNNKVLIPMIYDSVNYQESKNYFICNNNSLIINITPDNTIIKVED
jgi:hypothetical protein